MRKGIIDKKKKKKKKREKKKKKEKKRRREKKKKKKKKNYSTVTDFARLRGWSTSVPLISATW